jgi:soluble lytic murein transglycosylase-like protein
MRLRSHHLVLALTVATLFAATASAVANEHPDPAAPDKPALQPEKPVPPGQTAVRNRNERIARYRAIARAEAAKHGLPFELADAVMRVESNYNEAARGKDGEYGVMQVMPPTARMLGLKGPIETLAEPEINIALGVKYLADAWRLAKGDICTAAMKYRAGHGETRFSVLSVQYCARVRQHLASVGYPLTGAIPEATFGFRRDITRMGVAIGTQQAAKRLATGKKLRSRVDWAGYNARMKDLDRKGRVSLGGI